MKYIGIFLLWLFLATQTLAQSVAFTGTVIDEHHESLPGAVVQLVPGSWNTTTDENGKFAFLQIQAGEYTLLVSYVGFKTEQQMVRISAGNNHVSIELFHQADLLDEVVIQDNYGIQQKRESSYNSEVVGESYIKQNLGGSLMQSLERLPGVGSIDIGAGQSKPVIRGLSFNRVLVAENGIVHQGQQWGADHGLEIDQFATDRIEVIKGPASLMFGSDAIGGVVDIRQMHVPEKHTLGGVVNLTGKTNNKMGGASVNLTGRSDQLYFDARGTYVNYADFRVPTDVVDVYNYPVHLHNHQLRNTAGRESNLHLNLGIIQKKWSSTLYMSQVYSKSGFFANAHGLEPRQIDEQVYDADDRDVMQPFQEVAHLKFINKTSFYSGKNKWELEWGYQNNFRQEWSDYVSHGYMPPVFPDSLGMSEDLERQFNKNTLSAKGKLVMTKGKHTLTTGFSTEYQHNAISGRSFIIPAYEQLTAGVFLLDKITLTEQWILNGGIRFDLGNLNTKAYHDWFSTPVVQGQDTIWMYLQRAADLQRTFSSTSWAVGANYNGALLSVKANAGKSFRMPTAQELSANGVNYHHFSFEQGDSTLHPEVSYQLDLSAELTFPHWAVQLSPFVNYFPNYIYLNPTPYHDYLYGAGNQVYQYTESEVFRYGGELHLHMHPFHWMKAGVIAEYVYSVQLSGAKKNYTLPFSPPARVLINVTWLPHAFKGLKNNYFSIDYVVTAAQNRIVPPELTTPGHQAINLSAGTAIKWNKQWVEVNLQVRNLLNTKYLNHTSYYRIIGVPEPGINFIVNVSVPFSILGHE